MHSVEIVEFLREINSGSIECQNVPIDSVEISGFYVKSILADFRRSKSVILTIFEALIFGKIPYLKCPKFPKT